MKKTLAVILAGVMALSLTACGKNELKVKNYTIAEEAEYYQKLSGNDVSCKMSISMHPSLFNSAMTMPTLKSDISDSWYNDTADENATFGVYKSLSNNEDYSADTLLILSFSGSTDNLGKGINKDTIGKYLDRYFKSNVKKAVGKFIEEDINSDADKKPHTLTVDFEIGGMIVKFEKNDDSMWTLEIDAYCNNDVLDENSFIDSEKVAKVEPFVSEDYVNDLIGEKELAVNFNSSFDLFELRTSMEKVGYQTVNAIYQSDRSVTVNTSDSGETVTYYTGVLFKSTNGKGETVSIKQSYTVDSKNKTVKYTLAQPSDTIADDKLKSIIVSLTNIEEDTVKNLIEKKNETVKIDESTEAVMDSESNLTVTVNLK